MTVEGFKKFRMNWSCSLCGGINETKKRQPLKHQPIIICPCDHVYLPTLCREVPKKALLGISNTNTITCELHRVTLLSKSNSKETRAEKIIIKTCDWMVEEW